MDENKKYIIDFFKVLTGFASGSFLLVINFISKNDAMNILEADCLVKSSIILSLLCFIVSMVVGIVAIQNAINTINEVFGKTVSFKLQRKLFFFFFALGYFFLLFGIGYFLFFNNKSC